MVHFGDEPDRVGRAVEEVALEAVEVLDGQHHAGALRVLGDGAHAVDAPLPFVLRSGRRR